MAVVLLINPINVNIDEIIVGVFFATGVGLWIWGFLVIEWLEKSR